MAGESQDPRIQGLCSRTGRQAEEGRRRRFRPRRINPAESVIEEIRRARPISPLARDQPSEREARGGKKEGTLRIATVLVPRPVRTHRRPPLSSSLSAGRWCRLRDVLLSGRASEPSLTGGARHQTPSDTHWTGSSPPARTPLRRRHRRKRSRRRPAVAVRPVIQRHHPAAGRQARLPPVRLPASNPGRSS